MIKSVVIVAAGTGSRMGSLIPKPYLLLHGLPILMHTIRRFYAYDPAINLIVVISPGEIDRWNSLILQYQFSINHTVISGGATRFDSVRIGLTLIDTGLVAIHDGVRPLISIELIKRCFEEAAKFSNAVPAIPVIDTIRKNESGFNVAIDRTNLRQVQTPQCFDTIKLKSAYSISKGKNFTDDAGVFEAAGNKIHLVEGEKLNIKITDSSDLIIADAIMNSNNLP